MTLSDDLIQAVARALDENGVLDVPDDAVGTSIGWPANEKKRVRSLAKAALNALTEAGMVIVPREPTEGMIGAGFDRMDYDDSMSEHADGNNARIAANVYGSMIQAFHKEQTDV